jgi:copper transport protein
MTRFAPLVDRRVLTRLLVACAIAILALGAAGRTASAHALYEKSQPASGGQLETPGQVQVSFTEAVEPQFSQLEVLDVSRKKVDLGDSHAAPGTGKALVVSVPQLPDGTYMVAWRALSAVDGHVTRGVFPLVVGAGGLDLSVADAPVYVPNPGDVLARWLGYVSAVALLGAFAFNILVARRPLGTSARAEVAGLYATRLRTLGLAACGGVLISALVGAVFQAANAADVSPWQAIGEPTARLLGTRLGLLWQLRFACGVLIGLAFLALRGRVLDWVGLTVGALLMLAVSFSSHAAAAPSGVWLTVLADWLHQMAAATWVGGLFAFVLLAGAARARLPSEGQLSLLAVLVPRFSAVAIGAVAVLAVTGFFQTWIQVKEPQALMSLYGWALIGKIALILPMLLLGAANLLVIRPGLARQIAARGGPVAATAIDLARRFRVAIVAEAALGIAVLLATGVLTSSEPARESYARQPRPIELQGTAEDVGVQIKIEPGRPGPNQFTARLDGHIQPPNDVQRVTLRFTNLDDELGSSNLVLQPRDDGTFGAVGSNVTVDGTWQIETIVRRRGLDDARTAFRSPITTPDVAGQPPSLDAVPNPADIPPRRLISLALMAAGLSLTFWISRTRDVLRRERIGLYAASFAVAMIGGVLYARASAASVLPPDVKSLRNPFPPDTASIERGRTLYEQNCVTCHGLTGRGDGPLAATLRPRPADFRAHMAAGHTDGELFTWLSKGVPGTAMPAFEGQISEDDRWHLINYIRGFAPSTD